MLRAAIVSIVCHISLPRVKPDRHLLKRLVLLREFGGGPPRL